MILHTTFKDGSNPWTSLPADRHTVAKHWRRWMKLHPYTAMCSAFCNGWCCLPDIGGGYIVGRTFSKTETRRYKHLGHALAALERLGGAQQ